MSSRLCPAFGVTIPEVGIKGRGAIAISRDAAYAVYTSRMETKSSLAPLMIAVGLIFGAVLVITMLLILSGFLTAPFILMALLVVISLGILFASIAAAVRSRRP
jgi:VIT1/CCC1 family predicted Fe2+/Mn2+ transporter